MVRKKTKKVHKTTKKKVAIVPKKYRHLSYNQLLQHPKWQHKRLKIMERDKWRCRECKSTEKQLHVHHKKYTVKLPWLESNKNLITYCVSCHKKVHKK